MIIPANFFNVSFNKAMAFGYKTEDVDDFVTQAIQYIKDLQEENAAQLEKMGVLASNLEKYREEEDSLRSALIGAHKLGDSILRDSRGKAETILRDATTRADTVTAEAALELERQQYELEFLKKEVSGFKERLFDLYRSHLDAINHIPSMDAVEKGYREHARQPAAPHHQPAEPDDDKDTHAATPPGPEPVPAEVEEQYPQDSYQEDLTNDVTEVENAPLSEEAVTTEETLEDFEEQSFAEETFEDESFANQPLTEEQFVKENFAADDFYADSLEDEPAKAAHSHQENYPQDDFSEDGFAETGFFQEDFLGEDFPPESPTPETLSFDFDGQPFAPLEPYAEESAEPFLQVEAVAREEESDDAMVYTPRSKNHAFAGAEAVYTPIPMVQMEFDSVQEESEDSDFDDAQSLRSVDLNRIPYFDDEDDEDLLFGAETNSAAKKKPIVSPKFGVLKFGDGFDLADD